MRAAVSGVVIVLAILVATVSATAGPTADAPPRIALVVDPAGCREAFVRVLCSSFAKAVRRTGVAGRIVIPSPYERWDETLAVVARQGYDLVVVGLPGDLIAVARRFPKTRFTFLDTELPDAPRNAQGIVVQTNEAAFLAGALAARMEQRRDGRDVVGVVGGAKIPPVDEFVLGFRAGARHVEPGITVLVGYANDFANPRRCRTLALKQIAKGAGVLFNVAGGCGVGTLDAAGERGVRAIGVDGDQSFFGPHVLTSVVKRFEAVFEQLATQARAGDFRGGQTTALGLAQGAAALVSIAPDVPRQVRAELARLRRQIVAGRIEVPGARVSQRTGFRPRP